MSRLILVLYTQTFFSKLISTEHENPISLINVKMATIIFISMINKISESLKARNLYFSAFYFDEN